MARTKVYIGYNSTTQLYYANTVPCDAPEEHFVEMPVEHYRSYLDMMQGFSDWQSRLGALFRQTRAPKMSEEEREEREELQRLLAKYPDVLDG